MLKRKYLPYGLTKTEKKNPKLRRKLASCIRQVENKVCPKSAMKKGDYSKCAYNPVAVCRASLRNGVQPVYYMKSHSKTAKDINSKRYNNKTEKDNMDDLENKGPEGVTNIFPVLYAPNYPSERKKERYNVYTIAFDKDTAAYRRHGHAYKVWGEEYEVDSRYKIGDKYVPAGSVKMKLPSGETKYMRSVSGISEKSFMSKAEAIIYLKEREKEVKSW